MMRICSPQLGLSPQAALGGEVYDRELLTRLAGLGADVDVLLPAGQPYPPVTGLHVTFLPLRRGYRWFISNPLLVHYIGRAYRRQPFDVLRVHSLRFTGLAALWARRLYHLPVPIMAHHHHLDRDRWTGQVERRVAQAVDRLITGSHFARQQLVRELKVSGDKIAVVYYGVADHYRPGPAGEMIGRQLNPFGGPILLHVGSLKPRKNLPALLEAFASVLPHFPKARLVLVGRGPGKSVLQAQARQLGLAPAVYFAGFVSEEDKLAYYQSATLVVSPSLLEGFGFAVAEAMACGRPVVATQAGSLPELVADGETGLLAPAGDAAALSQAILRLLRDEELARRMGQAGAARVDALFRWDRAARLTWQQYEALLCPPAS
ncbi:MAG: glycosyltransferase family 4 protein [Chloroflexi bacterium]|nr:glycosyltransferase family 4 protein [Chloroflexota bacterium]